MKQRGRYADCIQLPDDDHPVTRRAVLSKLSKIYDPLSLVSPLTLEGKLVYRAACDAKTPWDAKLNDKLSQRWKKWKRTLPKEESVPRPMVDHKGGVEDLELHVFEDTSTHAKSWRRDLLYRATTVCRNYATTCSWKRTTGKQGLTVPRLELVSATWPPTS